MFRTSVVWLSLNRESCLEGTNQCFIGFLLIKKINQWWTFSWWVTVCPRHVSHFLPFQYPSSSTSLSIFLKHASFHQIRPLPPSSPSIISPSSFHRLSLQTPPQPIPQSLFPHAITFSFSLVSSSALCPSLFISGCFFPPPSIALCFCLH